MTVNGIDVSKWQGAINWSAAKNDGVKFAIIRAGYGKKANQKDPQFENNYAGCKSNGVPCGVYWYSYALSVEEAKAEAAACLEVIKGKTFEYPIYFDLEEKAQFKLGKAACTKIARAFLETVEAAGYWVGLYMSKSPLESYIDAETRKRFAVWVAHYGVSKTTYSGQFGMWQRSSTGKIDGIVGDVDLNECYIDYPKLIKNAGRNGFKKPLTDSAEKKKTYTEYTIKENDNLTKIAEKFNTTVEKIAADNGIKNINLIIEGKKLKIYKN